MILRLVLVALVLAVLAFAVWVRLAPLPVDRYHRMDSANAPGDWPARGGFEAVRQVPEPRAALVALARAAELTPRTELLEGSVDEGLLTFVTRSAVWGFPDISNVWIDGDRVHLRAHLVFGGSDFGVNRARVEAWLAQAGL